MKPERTKRVVAGAAGSALLAVIAMGVAAPWRFSYELPAVTRGLLWSGALAAAVGAAGAGFMLARAFGGKSVPAAGRVVWALVVGGVGGLVVNAVWMQPFLWVRSAVCAAWMAGAVGVLLAALSVREGFAERRWARIAGRIALQACAAVVLVELGLRGLALAKPSQVLTLPSRGAEEFLAAHRRPPHTPVWDLPTNSLGHYDEEFEPRGDRPLVAAISDSFGFAAVPHHFHFTTVCERLLAPLDVANFSVPGVGPPEYALVLEREALPLNPDMIVVDLFVGNDLRFPGVEGYGPKPWLRTLLDRDRMMLAHIPARLWRLSRRPELRIESAAPKLAATRMTPEDLLRTAPWLADPMLETPVFSEEDFLEIEFERALDICGPDESFYPNLFDALERLRTLAGDVPIAFVLIPDEFQVEDELWETVVAHHAGIPLERDRAQRRLREWFDERSIPCEDLLPRLRALPERADGRRHAYRLRDTHFNAIGSQVAGEGMAALVSRVLKMEPARTSSGGSAFK